VSSLLLRTEAGVAQSVYRLGYGLDVPELEPRLG